MNSRTEGASGPASGPEFAMLIVSILVIAGGWAAFVPNGQVIDGPQTEVLAIAQSGDAGKQVVFALIYLINLVLLARAATRQTWQYLGFPLLMLLAWCLLSTAWSVLPDATIRRVIAMTGTVIVGTYAGHRFNEERLSAALCAAAAVAAAGSLLWGSASHAHGFDTDGNLRGLFYHKNALGLFMATSLLAVFYRVVVLRKRHLPYFLLLGLCTLTFLLAHSATPLVGMTAALIALFVANWARGSGGLVQIMLPGAILVTLAIAILFSSDLSVAAAETLGRDPSFSGRTAIWAFILPMIGAHPWLGYGYGIFWLGEDAPGALFWYWTKQFELHAHDGYLQLLLDTGVVGLVLFLSAVGLLIIRTINLSDRGRWALSLWVALFLGFFLVCNITDTELWQSNSMMTTLFIWMVVRINKETLICSVSRRNPARKGLLTSQELS